MMIAQAIDHQSEQLAGGGDLGDVASMLAAAGDDGILGCPRAIGGPLTLVTQGP